MNWKFNFSFEQRSADCRTRQRSKILQVPSILAELLHGGRQPIALSKCTWRDEDDSCNFGVSRFVEQFCTGQIALRVQLPKNHIFTQNLNNNSYFPKAQIPNYWAHGPVGLDVRKDADAQNRPKADDKDILLDACKSPCLYHFS